MAPSEIVTLIVLNTAAWLVIQLGFAWAGTRLPAGLFGRGEGYFRARPFERDGAFYVNILGVRLWKDLLPDGAKLFKGGFPKGRLAGAGNDYLRRFVLETRRGEAVHGAVILASVLFFLWNPPDIAVWMIVYALVSNLPCMVIQRYNRIRILRILGRPNLNRA